MSLLTLHQIDILKALDGRQEVPLDFYNVWTLEDRNWLLSTGIIVLDSYNNYWVAQKTLNDYKDKR